MAQFEVLFTDQLVLHVILKIQFDLLSPLVIMSNQHENSCPSIDIKKNSSN